MIRRAIALLLRISWIVGVVPLVGATPFPQPDDVHQSLFRDDNCTPPCWFGMTPGVSTTDEVETILESLQDILWWEADRDNVLDPITHLTVDGNYSFAWKDFEREDKEQVVLSEIDLREGNLYSLWILMNRMVVLEETLDGLGPPTFIRFSVGYYGILHLDLIYPELLLRVSLKSRQHLCTLAEFATSFWVDSVAYYSPEAALEPQTWPTRDEPQPALLAYILPSERDIPYETWITWLNGEIEMTCAEAWEQLPSMPTEPTASDSRG